MIRIIIYLIPAVLWLFGASYFIYETDYNVPEWLEFPTFLISVGVLAVLMYQGVALATRKELEE